MLLVWTLQYLHHSAHSLVLTAKSQSVLSPQMSPTIIETWISTLNMETNHWNKPICTILSVQALGFCTACHRSRGLLLRGHMHGSGAWHSAHCWWHCLKCSWVRRDQSMINKSVYTVLTSAHSDTSLVHSFVQCIGHHGNFSKVLSSVVSPVVNVNRTL